MPALEFFIIVILLGTAFMGFAGIIGKRANLERGLERYSLHLTLELSFAAITFGLLPITLFYLLDTTAWPVASVFIGFYLMVEILRVYRKAHFYQVAPSIPMISLLVISGVLLTIELINAVLWASEAVYIFGLYWVLILAGVQFVTFVLYDRKTEPKTPASTMAVQSLDPVQHGPAVGLRGHRRSGDPYRTNQSNLYGNLPHPGGHRPANSHPYTQANRPNRRP
ncbi:MAG: hypothetical protein OHK0046_11020 [Anaerolineae bacterium]